ncbi:MAG: diguanylate cyclase [Candidatus Omnitrophica bacterium]|nr:diguanylate cyclase [Candidatus Omnitrophota bacterium]
MQNWYQKMLLSSKKVKNELWVAFGLIAMIILVLIGYVFPNLGPIFEIRDFLPLILGILFALLIVGMMIIHQMLESILHINREAKMIVKGDLSREIQLMRNDELGELGQALNTMTSRLRSNVEQLKKLSKSAETIKDDINSRIFLLANLMEISHKISQHAPLQDVLDVALKHCLIIPQSVGCIVLRDPSTQELHIRCVGEYLDKSIIEKGVKGKLWDVSSKVLEEYAMKQEIIVVDHGSAEIKKIEELKKMLPLKNLILVPVSSQETIYGFLVVGNNNQDFVFPEVERELIRFVGKHVAIAVLNDLLGKQVKRLEFDENATELFSGTVVQERLDKSIKDAVRSQRACSLILLHVDDFDKYSKNLGFRKAENALMRIVLIVKENFPHDVIIIRVTEDRFALILMGKNKKESIHLAELATDKIKARFSQEQDPHARLTVTAAVVENPIDGVNAETLIQKSVKLLEEGKGNSPVKY